MTNDFLEHVLDKKYEGTPRINVPNLPVEAIQGVSPRQAELLKEAFGISTIEQLGHHQTFHRAHAISIICAAKSGGASA